MYPISPFNSIVSSFLISLGASTALTAQSISGVLTRDVWTPVSGYQVLDFLESDTYYGPSNTSNTLSAFDSERNHWRGYGERLHGYITAPVTGYYQFYSSASDSSMLMLGSDEFELETLIDCRSSTRAKAWGDLRDQISTPRLLQAGQRYYIALVHKDGKKTGHAHLAWSYSETAKLTNWTQSENVTASQSTDHHSNYSANKAIDGNSHGSSAVNPKTLSHTKNEVGSWWQVDLGEDRQIDRLEMFNRDGDWWTYAKRLSNYRVIISNAAGEEVLSKDFHTEGSYTKAVELWETGGVIGSQVRVELLGANAYGDHVLCLSEVKVLGRADTSASYQGIGAIPSEILSSYAGSPLDLDGDKLKDSWELEHGFDTTTLQLGEYSPAADPDKDGIVNAQEARRSSGPFLSTSLEQRLTVEYWPNLADYSVEDLVLADDFYQEPARRYTVGTTSYTDLEKNSAARLRGYITAPESGSYTFWLSAVDGAQLWLSKDDTKYRKQKLAELGAEVGTGHGVKVYDSNRWDRYTSQISHEVHLEAGERYFLEVLTQHGHPSGYHCSVAWARPGQAREDLPLEFIDSYAFETEDSDDHNTRQKNIVRLTP